MNRLRALIPLMCGSLVSGAAIAHFEWSVLPNDFSTESSLKKAAESAKQSRKQVIVYYTRTNCPPCEVLQGRLRNESIAKPFRDSYVFTAVWRSSMSRSEAQEYRSRYGVEGAPTWLFFTDEGIYVCTSRGGFKSEEDGMKLHQAVQSLLGECQIFCV